MRNSYNNNWAIVGFDYDKASKLMKQIERTSNKNVVRSVGRIGDKECLVTEFSDGTTVRWINKETGTGGEPFGKMWCDETIDEDMFNTLIIPLYKGNTEDIIWL